MADLYAGSGALGIEALSRGAAEAVFVERSRRALGCLRQNLATCGLEEHATVVAHDVGRALERGLPSGPVDIALLDPPYDLAPAALAAVLDALPGALSPGAVVVVEAARQGDPPQWPKSLRASQTRRYGDTVLHIATRRDASPQAAPGAAGAGPP